MATPNVRRRLDTDIDFEKMFRAATRRGKERLMTEPRAEKAKYDAKSRRLVIDLRNGCVLMVPVDLLQGLRGASDKQLADLELKPPGFDLHWKSLDAQFSITGLMVGVFGTKKWMAQIANEREQVMAEE